ncbi:hypothetical protein GJ496_003603 [Pomphorhynchus laevis]|nr:hypothetical protein GJ496_003603 [Pomphorhynchus laevis]
MRSDCATNSILATSRQSRFFMHFYSICLLSHIYCTLYAKKSHTKRQKSSGESDSKEDYEKMEIITEKENMKRMLLSKFCTLSLLHVDDACMKRHRTYDEKQTSSCANDASVTQEASAQFRK